VRFAFADAFDLWGVQAGADASGHRLEEIPAAVGRVSHHASSCVTQVIGTQVEQRRM
jgi:hypothetical protein